VTRNSESLNRDAWLDRSNAGTIGAAARHCQDIRPWIERAEFGILDPSDQGAYARPGCDTGRALSSSFEDQASRAASPLVDTTEWHPESTESGRQSRYKQRSAATRRSRAATTTPTRPASRSLSQ